MARKSRVISTPSQKPLRETLVPSINIILSNNNDSNNNDKENVTCNSSELNPAETEHAPTTASPLLYSDTEDLSGWMTSQDLIQNHLPFTQDIMFNLNDFLLGNPNVNSTHLFRADILFDSAGRLKTPAEKERLMLGNGAGAGAGASAEAVVPLEDVDGDHHCHDTPQSYGSNNNGISNNTQPCSKEQFSNGNAEAEAEAEIAPRIPGFELKRTVVRILIPRKPNVDKPLKQTCFYYEGCASTSTSGNTATVERALYLFLADIKSPEDVPFYFPLVRGWAFLYDFEESSSAFSTSDPSCEKSENHEKYNYENEETKDTDLSLGNGTLSLHFLPFPPAEGFDPFPVRLERILRSLISTHIRLAQHTRPSTTTTATIGTVLNMLSPDPDPQHTTIPTTSSASKTYGDDSYNPNKDNIIPRHMIQNTYSRLKLAYAHDLCQRWIETTDPSKHVFEDLMITAFLIELWRNMYGVLPKAEREEKDSQNGHFSGFVDIACGNGVLVYVLLMEGYRGWGFDARRRKTWSIFPEWVQSNLKEAIYIPKPFVEHFVSTTETGVPATSIAGDREDNGSNPINQHISHHGGIQYTTADFPRNTFVISNHADELTVWTPLLAALACPEDPLPFLSIPCCSHALSGARYRYPPPKKEKTENQNTNNKEKTEEKDNNKTGDLKALRAEKQAASTASSGSDLTATAVLNSMYGSLTAKTMSVAEQVGYEVERTLLRIPSTRNIGVIGGRMDAVRKWQGLLSTTAINNGIDSQHKQRISSHAGDISQIVNEVVESECVKDGGVQVAARVWIDRAMGLQKTKK